MDVRTYAARFDELFKEEIKLDKERADAFQRDEFNSRKLSAVQNFISELCAEIKKHDGVLPEDYLEDIGHITYRQRDDLNSDSIMFGYGIEISVGELYDNSYTKDPARMELAYFVEHAIDITDVIGKDEKWQSPFKGLQDWHHGYETAEHFEKLIKDSNPNALTAANIQEKFNVLIEKMKECTSVEDFGDAFRDVNNNERPALRIKNIELDAINGKAIISVGNHTKVPVTGKDFEREIRRINEYELSRKAEMEKDGFGVLVVDTKSPVTASGVNMEVPDDDYVAEGDLREEKTLLNIYDYKDAPLFAAIIELNDRLKEEGISGIELNVVGGFAMMTYDLRNKDGITDIDYIGPELPKRVEEISESIGVKYHLGSEWINNHMMITGTTLEDLEFTTGKLHFKEAFELESMKINVIDTGDLLRLKVIAVDTALVEAECGKTFSGEKHFADVEALKKALNVDNITIREEFADYITSKYTVPAIKAYELGGMAKVKEDIFPQLSPRYERPTGPYKRDDFIDGVLKRAGIDKTRETSAHTPTPAKNNVNVSVGDDR